MPFAVSIGIGDHRCYAVGCGTLSKRERGVPPSFNEVTWDAETVTVTAHAWARTRFEPYRTWSLPRRGTA